MKIKGMGCRRPKVVLLTPFVASFRQCIAPEKRCANEQERHHARKCESLGRKTDCRPARMAGACPGAGRTPPGPPAGGSRRENERDLLSGRQAASVPRRTLRAAARFR